MHTFRRPSIHSVWQHTKTGGHYEVVGYIYNTLTDAWDVKYRPLYPSEFSEFSRQISDHPKAWYSLNDDGSMRYEKIGHTIFGYAWNFDWRTPPNR